MQPQKVGQIVRFHSPLHGENPNQLYVVLAIFNDVEKPRAEIKALNSGKSFVPINTVLVKDLEIAEVDTNDLIGKNVIISKPDLSQVAGKVLYVEKEKILLELVKGAVGVETNVFLTIQDQQGEKHSGSLFVN